VALASYYLMSSFPEKRIALFGEIDLETDDLDAFDAILLPNVAMGAMKDDSVDLVFNSYSLAEMSRETIDCYIKEVNRFSAKFFYHVNHTKNSLVKASEFPVDRRKFELLYRAPALWNFARNPGMDEFEFLYINRAMQFSAVSRPRA
jgi:hypothetical protein